MYLSPRQLAKLTGHSPAYIRRAIREGVIPARFTPGGHAKISLATAQRFAERAFDAEELLTVCQPRTDR
jgi:excisionase family DNA binding protein